MWIFDESTKDKYGKQKRKGFLEAMDEIENKPEVGYSVAESRSRRHKSTKVCTYLCRVIYTYKMLHVHTYLCHFLKQSC